MALGNHRWKHQKLILTGSRAPCLIQSIEIICWNIEHCLMGGFSQNIYAYGTCNVVFLHWII